MTADQHHRYPCDHAVPIDQEPRHHLVIENELVRAFAVEIAPHDRTLCHHHAHDYLLYVVGDGDIISTARDEEPKKLSYRNGECELSDAGLTHVVENVGEEPFRNIVVELLAKGNELRRGVDPQKVLGDADIKRMLDDPRGAIFSIEIEPGSEVTIPGPGSRGKPVRAPRYRQTRSEMFESRIIPRAIWRGLRRNRMRPCSAAGKRRH